MTREKLLKSACERCEEYSINTKCESQSSCPVYKLYLLCEPIKRRKEKDDWRGAQGTCDFDPQPKPEMI